MPSRWNSQIVADTAAAAAAAIITRAGANARLLWCDGPLVAGGALTVANRVLSTDIAGSVLGTVSGGAVDIDESSITQNPSTNVDGTPTFLLVRTSGGAYVGDLDIGAGPDKLNIVGTIKVNQPKTLTNLRIPVL